MVARKPRKPLFFTQDCTRVCQGHQRGFVSCVGARWPWLPALPPLWVTGCSLARIGSSVVQICSLWARGSVPRAPEFARMGDLERILLLAFNSTLSGSFWGILREISSNHYQLESRKLGMWIQFNNSNSLSSLGVNPHFLSEENHSLLQEPAQPALVSLGKEAEINYFPFATSFSQREWTGNTTSICPFLDTSFVLSAIQEQSLGLKQFFSKGFTVLSTLCPPVPIRFCVFVSMLSFSSGSLWGWKSEYLGVSFLITGIGISFSLTR